MNRRIHYGKNTPLSFRESLSFDVKSPYMIRYKEFVNDDIAPPHYADTLELLVCREVTGEIIIEGSTYIPHGPLYVIVIPPGAVHSVRFNNGPGHIYVLHVSLPALADTVDIAALLALEHRQLTGMMNVCPHPEIIHALIHDLIDNDSAPLARFRVLLEIFETFRPQLASDNSTVDPHNQDLQKVIRWTESNFQSAIQLSQAAAAVSFSKNYFCTWFKSKTGMTYNNYLNRVRINNACRLLAKRKTIAEACYESGFGDLPYFIQLFKRIQGCTPKRYINSLSPPS